MKFWNFAVIKDDATNQETVELRIDGEIVSDDDSWLYEWLDVSHAAPNAFRKELANYKDNDITVWVNSPGGDVFAGATIYNALKEHKGKVTVKVDSQAMSIASVIAMAGDEVLMSPVAVFMIHNPWSGVRGDMHDMRKMADVLDTIKETLINAYVSKTGKSKAEISKLMDDETWLSAEKAQNMGFADGILYNDGTNTINNMAFSRNKILNYSDMLINKFIEKQKKENQQNSNELELLKAKLRLSTL